jgi:hypothetical protein
MVPISLPLHRAEYMSLGRVRPRERSGRGRLANQVFDDIGGMARPLVEA